MTKRRNKDIVEVIQNVEKDKLLIHIDRIIGEKSFYEFFKMVMKNCYSHIDFQDNWHYEVICNKLQEKTERWLRGEKCDKHLLMNVSFRSGKSILINEVFPCWLWVKNPQIMIQNVCSTQSLATKSARVSRNIMNTEWFLDRWKIELMKDQNSKSDYSTTANGTRQSYGIDSSIIGTGCDIQIIDDPNDPKDSHSVTSINNVINTFKDVLLGRMNNEKAFRIILQQRTNEKDLAGYILSNNADDYDYICIPGELTDKTSPEYVDYYEDGLFFPKLFSKDRLKKLKSSMNATAYASQILQQPSALEGDLIKREWFLDNIVKKSVYEELLKRNPNTKRYLVLDTASTSSLNNDPTAFLFCSVIEKNLYITRVEQKWLEFNPLIESVLEYIKSYNIREVIVENKSSGIALYQELKRRVNGGCMVKNITPVDSKVERANQIQPYLIYGKVKLVEDDLWLNMFLDQCSSFPHGAHDDIVDVLVYAVYKYLIKNLTIKL